MGAILKMPNITKHRKKDFFNMHTLGGGGGVVIIRQIIIHIYVYVYILQT